MVNVAKMKTWGLIALLLWPMMATCIAAEQSRASALVLEKLRSRLEAPSALPKVAGAAGSVSDEFLQELAAQFSEESLWDTELDLVGFGTRYTFREENLAAADWLYERLSSLGLEVEFMDDYSFAGWPIRNVIGTLRGSVEPERVVVISGHFDTIVYPDPNNVFSDAPGANDNTAADATVLECARILSQYEPALTIKFALYSGEEQIMLGSEYVICKWLDEGMNVVANVNMDCLGWSDDGSLKTRADVNWNSEWLLEFVSRAASFTSVAVKETVGDSGEEIWYASDHYWFWYYGIPALYVGEGWGLSPYRHSLNDTPENINKPLFVECARLVLLTTALLAFDEPAMPHLSVFANIKDIQPGDTLAIDVSFVNPGATESLVFYMALVTPQGEIFFFPAWTTDIQGTQVTLPAQTWSQRYTLCRLQVPCASPPLIALGRYRIVAALADRDGTFVSNTAEAVFTLGPRVRCPEGMVRVPAGSYTGYFGQSHFVKEFCIDKYEYPNIQGEVPLDGVTWLQAWSRCTEEGKFLCSKDQWVRACKGSKSSSFPYGDQYIAGVCNTEGTAILPSGSCPQCVSEFGAFDMSGNVYEWTSGSNWQNAGFGGWFKSRDFTASCEYTFVPYPAPAGLYTYGGFRCCWHN